VKEGKQLIAVQQQFNYYDKKIVSYLIKIQHKNSWDIHNTKKHTSSFSRKCYGNYGIYYFAVYMCYKLWKSCAGERREKREKFALYASKLKATI
jgi:hypothetical protein